jgi:hypothetical protein
MRCILIIVAMIALTAGLVRAEDAPSSNAPVSSEKGPNFPTPRRGPAFPATKSDQQHNRSFGAQAPTPQQRNVPLQAQPKKSSYPSGRAAQSFSSGQGWHTLPIGGGGWLFAVWGVCDQGPKACSPGTGTVTEMVHTDVGGTGYWYNRLTTSCGNANRTGCWEAILTPINMPMETNYGSLSSMRSATTSASNTQTVWVFWGQNGCLYKSTTGPGGVYSKPSAWTCVGYGETNRSGTSNNPMMLADPYNANLVYVSVGGDVPTTPGHGFRTLNGGTSFADTSTLFPSSTSTTPASLEYAFDISPMTPTGKCPTGGSGSCTNNVFAVSNGNGVYKSINAGTSFVKLNSANGSTGTMPAGARHIEVDPTGTLWLDDGQYPPNIYKWVPSGPNSTTGAWSLACGGCGGSGDPVGAIATDPNTSCTLASQNCHAVGVTFRGSIYETFNSGSTWVGNSTWTVAATDAPWLAVDSKVRNIDGIQVSSVYFDPTRSDVIVISGGDAIWETSPTGNSTTAFVWTSRTTAIEELVITSINAPPGFNPVVGGWDRGAWSLTSLTQYPTTYQWNISVPGSRAYHINYTNNFTGSGPGAQTGGLILTYNFGGCSGCTGGFYSSNYGNGDYTNLSNMVSVPQELAIGCSCYSGHNITGFDNTHFLWVVGQQGDVFGTTDGGNTWAKLAAPRVPVGGVGKLTVTSGRSTTLTFGGGLEAQLVASISAGNATSAQRILATNPNDWCNLGTVSSATSSSVTLATAPSCSTGVNSGDFVRFFTDVGWTKGGQSNPVIIVADRASTNVAYIANGNAANSGAAGIYKIYISGGTYHMVQVFSGQPTTPNMYQTAGAMLSVPSTPGDIYFSNASGTSPNSSWYLAECVDSSPSGTSSGTMTCKTVTTGNGYGANVANVWGMAAGKPKSGGSGYSGIYFYGMVNGTMGVWQTYDHFQTFTQIGGSMFEGCGNSGRCATITSDMFTGRFDALSSMAGSPDTQGLVYACFIGTACLYGQFN